MMLQNTRNELLKRKEVVYSVSHDKNPGFVESKKIIAKECKADEAAVVVTAVHSKFGSSEFVIHSNVYDSVDDKERFERKPNVKKAAGAA